ncbi:MAG: hypothetical protein NC417_11585 [Candidatus Gastranaerophilales bacterium]|nr:hypothetical protein [Candidatus Gastranaerophilales bacterium]
MKIWVNANDKVKRQAGDEMVILLKSWKKRVRRYRIYRCCLGIALFLSLTGLFGSGYYLLDSRIPSNMQMRAGEEQVLRLGVPASAELISVSGQGESNIPAGAVTIDLSEPVMLRTGDLQEYLMQVKLFGFLPFKEVEIKVVETTELVPMGIPVGIYVKTDGVLVIGVGEFIGANGVECFPAKYILRSGDYIYKVNGEVVAGKEDFMRRVEESGGEELVITVERDGELIEQRVTPQLDQSGVYKIGVWIRDNAQGVGTMTYMDKDGNFGALGHGINDVDTSTLMDMEDGTLYQTEIISVRRGEVGNPGEMTGMIVYSDDRIMGDITANSERGIFGVCNERTRSLAVEEPLPIAFKQEIEKGPAQILCTVDEEPQYYDVEILAVHLDHDNVNRGIELRVTDPELIELTGGIVQGMFTGYNWCKDTGNPVFT